MLRFFFKRKPIEPPSSNVADFLAALAAVAPPAGRGDYVFPNADGGSHGLVQFLAHSHREVIIHRLWTHQPGQKSGSIMLRILCTLADEHRVELTLKALPFGRKPYPMSREQLVAWYKRYGFEGTHKRMTRRPRAVAADSTPTNLPVSS
jgi:hypothetical protein